jgi:hypothetical protein
VSQHNNARIAIGAALVGASLVVLVLNQRSTSDGSTADPEASTAPARTEDAEPAPGADRKAPAVLLAIQARDISICDQPPPTPRARIELCRDEYHFFLSLKENVDHCGSIEQKMLGDACRMLMAGENRCNELVPEKVIDGMHEPDDIRLVCRSCFGDISACNAVKDSHDRGLCTSMHYLVKAARAKDPSVCDQITNETDNELLCRYLALR